MASRPLPIFTRALCARVLRAHAAGPRSAVDLEEEIGWAPESSLRAAMGDICDLGALVRHETPDRVHGETTELTAAGRDLLPVAASLDRWLGTAPSGPITLEDDAARGVLRVLLAARDSTVVRTVAERPHSLADLGSRIPESNESTLRRRLTKLRSTDLIVRRGSRRTATYAATDWLREAVVPLALAARWQLRHASARAPISPPDAETALLLALPLVELSPRASGNCTLAVLTPNQRTGTPEVAGIALTIERGTITDCEATTNAQPANWILGSAASWLDATVDGDPRNLRVGGAQPRLPRHIIRRLRETLRCPA